MFRAFDIALPLHRWWDAVQYFSKQKQGRKRGRKWSLHLAAAGLPPPPPPAAGGGLLEGAFDGRLATGKAPDFFVRF